jgi:alpha-beta hydrolase superfamily lysophospholipase
MQGHAVYSVTRRGSGCNDAARGDVLSAEVLLDDVACALRWVAADSGQACVHLLGVSWGGKLLAAALLRGMGELCRSMGVSPMSSTAVSAVSLTGVSPAVASLTLLAPGLVPQVDVPLWTKLRIAWAMLARTDRLFDIPLSEVELFTANPAMQDYLRRDAHRLHQATARFLFASRTLDRMIARAPGGAIAVPTTLVLAETDRIIDNARTQESVTRLTGGRAKVIQLPGHHTLEFEPDPQPLFDAMTRAIHEVEGLPVP